MSGDSEVWTMEGLLEAEAAGQRLKFLFFWGIGMTGDDPAAEHPSRWKGLNLLGFALMEARARLAS